jgi:hypothetical protein
MALAIIVAQQCIIQFNGTCWSSSTGIFNDEDNDSDAPVVNAFSSSSVELAAPRTTTGIAKHVVVADSRPRSSSSSFQPEKDTTEKDKQTQSNIQDFERQEGVAIVSKLHGSLKDINQLIQALCLLKVAYNERMKYDHVVFSSIPISFKHQGRLTDIAYPAKISFYNDTKPLAEALEDMTPSQKIHLAERCGVPSYQNITWQTYCEEKCAGGGEACYPKCQLQYLWQGECEETCVFYVVLRSFNLNETCCQSFRLSRVSL